MLARLAKAHDRLSDAGLWVTMAALAFVASLSFVATMSRYFLGAPIGWVTDWTGYLLVLTIFVSAPAVTRRGMHVSMDLLFGVIRSNVLYRLLTLIAHLLTLTILCVLCVVVAQSLGAAWRTGTSTAAAYPIPRWWLIALLLYGFAGSALHVLRTMLGLVPCNLPQLGKPPVGAPPASQSRSQE